MIGRREFITVLGGAAAWPLSARAQEGVRRIGVLLGNSEGNTQAVAGLAAFTSALAGFGWTEGRNLHVEYRWSAADVGRMQAFAKELVSLKPDLLVANSTPVTAALQRETKTIPIVFESISDPVGSGFVERPQERAAVCDLRRGGEHGLEPLADDEAGGDLGIAPKFYGSTLLAAQRHTADQLARIGQRDAVDAGGIVGDHVAQQRQDAGSEDRLPPIVRTEDATAMEAQHAVGVGRQLGDPPLALKVDLPEGALDRVGHVPPPQGGGDARGVVPRRYPGRRRLPRQPGPVDGQQLDRGEEVETVEPHNQPDYVAGDAGRLAASTVPTLFDGVDAEAIPAAAPRAGTDALAPAAQHDAPALDLGLDRRIVGPRDHVVRAHGRVSSRHLMAFLSALHGKMCKPCREQ